MPDKAYLFEVNPHMSGTYADAYFEGARFQLSFADEFPVEPGLGCFLLTDDEKTVFTQLLQSQGVEIVDRTVPSSALAARLGRKLP